MNEVEIGTCCNIVSGSTPSRKIKEYWNGNINWFTPKDLSNIEEKYVFESPEKISLQGFKSCSTNLLPPKSLLLSSRAPIGHLAINRKECCTNQGFKSLIPNNNIDVEYLYYAIKKIVPQLQNLGNGATFKELSKSTLEKVKILVPPLPYQQRIASILDAADALRKKTQQIIDSYDELAQSVFLDMFGDPVKNEKGWEEKKLREICTKITDGTHFSPKPQEYGFPYVTAKHVKEYGLDFYSRPTYISEDAHSEIFKRCTPEYGDILYIKDGATTGIACINTFKEPISLLSSLALLKPHKELLNNKFLCFWLNHRGIRKKLINEYMSGAAIQRYTLLKINMFRIALPPLSLQTQFAQKIQLIEQQKDLAKQSLKESEDLFQSLLQKAFKGALGN
jgi:type I restriction enzyme, S subunit